MIGDFITVAGFSFSELEDQLSEAKDKVTASPFRFATVGQVQVSVWVAVIHPLLVSLAAKPSCRADSEEGGLE